MSSLPLYDAAYQRPLDHGLTLRWSTSADTEGLAELYAQVFRDKVDEPPNSFVAAWTRDLMSGRHPLIDPSDFALVEDQEGRIVAATCLMRQTWEYSGIPFPVGRPEIVATLEGYRNRGLIRAIFELIHARSAEQGDLALGITGISYYYRQFGYEYALDLAGHRKVFFSAIPPLKADSEEPYTLRDAGPEDLPKVMALYDRERLRPYGGKPLQVSTQIDEAYWRFTLDGHSPESGEGWRTQLIQTIAGQVVGYVLTRRLRWGDGGSVGVSGFVVGEVAGLQLVLPSVLRALVAQAPTIPTRSPNPPEPKVITFALGRTHPVYAALSKEQGPESVQPYAWYVRVPDLPALVRHLAPVLEQRLQDSIVAGYTGNLNLDFYRDGLQLVWSEGRLQTAGNWRAPTWAEGNGAHAGFPPLVFLQLLFGHRSLQELRYAFPDVWANDTGTALLEALFPAQPSWVLPLD